MKQLYKVLAIFLASVVLLSGCSSTAGYARKTAAVYGDEVTYMDEANFWLRYYQWSYESYYGEMYRYYYGYDNMWILDSGNRGQTFAENIKETVMAEILQTEVILEHASEYDAELNDTDKERIAAAVKDLRDSFADEFFTLAGIPAGAEGDAKMNAYLTKRSRAVKLAEVIRSGLDVTISDRSNYESFTTSYVLVPADKEGSTAETTAEQLAVKVRMAFEDGKTLEEIKEQYSDLSTSTLSFARNNTSSESIVYTEGVGMKTGETKVVPVDGSGWYVLHCDDDHDEAATQEKIDAAIATARAEKFAELYKGWAKKEFKVKSIFKNQKVEPAYVAKAGVAG